MWSSGMVRGGAIAVVLLGVASPAAAATYDLIGLGDLPGGSFFSVANDLNDSGQVVGYSVGDDFGSTGELPFL